MTPWELQEEKQEAKIWKRPMRSYIFDFPFYPDCPPEPKVNFDLNFQ